MERSWLRGLTALLCGAGLASILFALLFSKLPAAVHAYALVEPGDLFAIGIGNGWLLAAPVALLALLGGPARALRDPLAALGIGFALGGLPLWGTLGAPPWLAAAAAAGLAGLALRFLRGGIPLGFTGGIAVLMLGATLAIQFRSMREHARTEVAFTLPARADSAPQGPDVVLISIDTLRADAVFSAQTGLPGMPAFSLPTFERLRAEGLWADYALSSSNQTLPGHVGMLTGLDAMDHRMRYNQDEVPADLVMLFERFRTAGWHTAAVIANELLSPDMGFGRGVELFDDTTVSRNSPVYALATWLDRHTWIGWLTPEKAHLRALQKTLFRLPRRRAPQGHRLTELGGRRRGRVTTDQVLAMLGRLQKSERPAFLFVNYLDPHHPYGAPAPFDGALTAGAVPPPPPLGPDVAGDQIRIDPLRAVEAGLVRDDPDAAKAAALYHRMYLENVAYTDALLGEVLAAIEAARRPTVLLITGDHGEHFGEHDLMLHGHELYEDVVRVPFVLWGTGVPPTGRLPRPAQLADVAPTLLQLAGVAVPESLRGRAVHLAMPEVPHVAVDDRWVSVRLAGWKWIGRWDDSGAAAAVALFDLNADPGEQRNLLDETEIPAELARAIKDALARNRYAARSGAIPDWQQERLLELGYAEGEVPPAGG